MRVVVLSTLVVFIVALAGCGRVDAIREFNHGVRYFDENKLEAAVDAFEKASETLGGPAVHYNLALARLALLRKADPGRASATAPQVAAALSAVLAGQALANPTDDLLAKLGYIEGSIHAFAGDEKSARRAFAQSLAARSDFKPTLKALLQLDPTADSAVGRLVLATVEVEQLKPMEELGR